MNSKVNTDVYGTILFIFCLLQNAYQLKYYKIGIDDQ